MNYIHKTKTTNGIEIDEELISLIQLLWKNEIRTYCSCQGGPLDPDEWDVDEIENDDNQCYVFNNNPYEYKHLIIHKDDLLKFQQVVCDFISEFKVLVGDQGYMLEWIENRPRHEDLLYIYWK